MTRPYTPAKLATAPAFFSLRRLDRVVDGVVAYGCQCAICKRDIQAPMDMQGLTIWCLYCGLDRGIVPEVDVPFGLAHDFGVTAEEAGAIARECDRSGGDVHSLLERRAKRLGQFLLGIGT